MVITKSESKKRWAIVGAGGFGREVYCVVKENINNLELGQFVGFFDDDVSLTKKNEFGNILGTTSDLNNRYQDISVFIAISSPKARTFIYNKLANSNFKFPNLLNMDFRILHRDSFKIGIGNIVLSRSSVSVNVSIGNFNILNSNISIGHDTQFGDFNTLMPSTKISGEVNVGNCNIFGLNSGVLQGVRIGNNITLGPMSILYKHAKDNLTYLGNPAKKFEF